MSRWLVLKWWQPVGSTAIAVSTKSARVGALVKTPLSGGKRP